jgi:hypothetical protein
MLFYAVLFLKKLQKATVAVPGIVSAKLPTKGIPLNPNLIRV